MQSYIFYVIQHTFGAKKFDILTYFNKDGLVMPAVNICLQIMPLAKH